MKVLPVVVAVAAVAGGAQHFRAGSGESIAGETAPSSTYRLTANGDEAACAVRRGAEVSGGLTLLTVGPNCRKLLPGIERAKFWREEADGTVAFSANGIDPIVTFSVADGDGYESYAPVTPLLALNHD
ncbi:hypothetical protein EN858_06915 [Mesorhizobium sp. M4B.F.Ca.ET.215.01.1.1]|uniref:Alkaline proteinase inhibitor/ Outer membrane lipoprotein Omp19 domain-containing protein n=1 Tax=Mesorhizobium abyssinicae TaxID=1209958 RepID=A0ABU5AVV5_9HYPH|nr:MULTISPECIES: hypothetical protein [Mesorhizobium]MDX8541445.1 hypothetical protein [Mesorhizobium abyssinicae]RUW25491.1 hypothetical protein EOA34_11625 [Mesorhizobium sp. M4B.F.Ca.ET.013.02.1.1]RWF66159.1 MAG: hypothetical protein EOS47_07380 [Mesorhizobium sp.]TGQ15558.1 hypothetical protein EN858_06915 [Mesorhizobium sp. M4B.F.Ca.ET.215.01.1.1]TGQ45669.1 hypothetical protein EN857_03040 [Mesorhizobium sp. M4B.F.Ca.ET.214.01.1.1]